MAESWQHCKNVLVIRADNMGDLIMSAPALRALKQTFLCSITVLTSSMAAGIAPLIAEIDDTLVFDLPWVKNLQTVPGEEILELIEKIKHKNFDAAVIFTVFSQNPLPAAMIAYMAGIPLRLAYCRENPYGLLTNWVPDKEPYIYIKHQVERDIDLVASVGASASDLSLRLTVVANNAIGVSDKLKEAGADMTKPWLIFHAGVSEKKREYPGQLWVEAARNVIDKNNYQILFTGSASEKAMCDELANATGKGAFSVAGLFSLQQFVALVARAPLVVSVNTGAVHIAAAVGTRVVVLYAQTNPQHTPWRVANSVLEFGVEEKDRSKNEVIQFLYRQVYKSAPPTPTAEQIVDAVTKLLKNNT